jgi:hypothetical protein
MTVCSQNSLYVRAAAPYYAVDPCVAGLVGRDRERAELAQWTLATVSSRLPHFFGCAVGDGSIDVKEFETAAHKQYVTQRNLAAWSNPMILMDSLVRRNAHAVPFRALDGHSWAAASLHVRHVLHITSERIPPGETCSWASGMFGARSSLFTECKIGSSVLQ